MILDNAVKNMFLFDTAIGSDNLGDEVIMDAVNRIMIQIFGTASFERIATHRRMTGAERDRAATADFGIVGGTNILKSRMLFRQNWKLGLRDFLSLRNAVMLGVGWQFYGGKPDLISRWFFRRALAPDFIHSVRDEHTHDLLRSIVPKVIYTGCPTMWEFDTATCARVPTTKAKKAIFSVTYYRPLPEVDRAILELLMAQYETVYLWAQQSEDVEYIKSLGIAGGVWIDRSLAAYDRVLEAEDVDVLGSRLHGGIRALSRGRRALILEIDNRAREIGRKTRLPCAVRDDLARMETWTAGSPPLTVTMPWDDIAAWKAQFKT